MEQNETTGKKSKLAKLVFFPVLLFIISGTSSLFFERYVFPWLATRDWLHEKGIFKGALDNVTVINKTEQITVSENSDISGYTQKSASTVVEIVARGKESKSAILPADSSVSGVIVASDGLVASFGDQFFAAKDGQYKVFLQDGKSFDAQIVATDSFSNIVLLKLQNAENLPAVEFVDPQDIKTGMKVAVIGRSGFNSEISLRLGVTSEWAKSFSISGPLASSEKLQGVLLADFSRLAVEGAESGRLAGGAVVDQRGNMIGILGERKENMDENYFIAPINYLQNAIGQYLEKGKIERATLGLYYVLLSKEGAYFFQNNFDRGALVYSQSGQQGLAVMAGSSAEKAGVKIGDIILNVNGEEVNQDQNLAQLISKYHPGETVNLHITRDGKEMDLSATMQ